MVDMVGGCYVAKKEETQPQGAESSERGVAMAAVAVMKTGATAQGSRRVEVAIELQSWTRPEKATGRSDVGRRVMASRARGAKTSTGGNGRRRRRGGNVWHPRSRDAATGKSCGRRV